MLAVRARLADGEWQRSDLLIYMPYSTLGVGMVGPKGRPPDHNAPRRGRVYAAHVADGFGDLDYLTDEDKLYGRGVMVAVMTSMTVVVRESAFARNSSTTPRPTRR